MSPQPERPGPRPRTWLALGALVLLAHAALVLDWGALWALAQPPERAGATSTTTPNASRPGAAASAPPPAVVRVAQVRWTATPQEALEPAPPPPAPTTPLTETPAPEASRTTERSDALPADQPLQAAPTRPTVLPGNRWLRYDVTGQAKGLNYRASGEVRWQTSDGRYQADLKISALLIGSRSQQSTGRLTDTGLVPERFADKSRSERAAHFEPEQGRIRFSNNAPDAPWLPGTQDRLSVFFQLAAWLNARPDGLREGQRLSLPVAGTSGAAQWQLLVQALEPLDLPAGRWEALRVEVLPQKTFDQRIELWLAPQLDHLPVRIRITQANGDVVDQQLSALP
jgi:hypothetical protein